MNHDTKHEAKLISVKFLMLGQDSSLRFSKFYDFSMNFYAFSKFHDFPWQFFFPGFPDPVVTLICSKDLMTDTCISKTIGSYLRTSMARTQKTEAA